MNETPAIFGEVLFDCFEDGSRELGGAPFNVSWHLQALGCKPLLISRVGDDPAGRQIRDTMQKWGMSTAGLQLDSSHSTGEVQVSLQDGQPSFDIVEDRAYDHIDAAAIAPMSSSLIYHGTLALRHADSAAALDQLLHHNPQTPVFLDVNLRPPWWDRDQTIKLLRRVKWVKVNDAELDILVEQPGELVDQAQRFLHQHDLNWLIVTRGKEGAISLDSDGNLFETTPVASVKVVDTVGAGDAFASVCIFGLQRAWPYQLIIERAQKFASLLVATRGATLKDPQLYHDLLAEWQ